MKILVDVMVSLRYLAYCKGIIRGNRFLVQYGYDLLCHWRKWHLVMNNFTWSVDIIKGSKSDTCFAMSVNISMLQMGQYDGFDTDLHRGRGNQYQGIYMWMGWIFTTFTNLRQKLVQIWGNFVNVKDKVICSQNLVHNWTDIVYG